MHIAKITEIFLSSQGEGLYLGVEQLFVRFFGCNLHCDFCDTKLSDSKEYSSSSLVNEVSKYRGFHSLSLTGGEPLVQANFLKAFLPEIKDFELKVYLETNGTLPDELLKVIDLVDIVSMDFKLPSSTGCKDFWREHEEFLKIAERKDTFVKMVITKNTQQQDIFRASEILKNLNLEIPVILQPNWFDVDSELLMKMVLFKKHFSEIGVRNLKILPQAHKYAGIK